MSDFSQYDEQVVVIFNVPGKTLEPMYFDNMDEFSSFLLSVSKTLDDQVYYTVYRVLKPHADYINVAVGIMDVRDRSIDYFNSYRSSLVRSSSGVTSLIPSLDLYNDHLGEQEIDLKISTTGSVGYHVFMQRLEFPHVKLFWPNPLDLTDAYPIFKGMLSANFFTNAFVTFGAKNLKWPEGMYEKPVQLNLFQSMSNYLSSKSEPEYYDLIHKQIGTFVAPFKTTAFIGDQNTLNFDPNHQLILEAIPMDVQEDVEIEEDYDVPEEMEAI